MGCGKSLEEQRSRVRSQGFRRILYLDIEVTKNCIRIELREERVNQVLKSSRVKEDCPGGE